jgi:hypothetical protein
MPTGHTDLPPSQGTDIGGLSPGSRFVTPTASESNSTAPEVWA